MGVAVCRQGLAHLLDRVAEHYSFSPLPAYNNNNNNNKASNSTESDSDSGFVSPASVVLLLARLLPILTAVLEEDGLSHGLTISRRVLLFSARQQMFMRHSPSRKLPQMRERLGPAPYIKPSHHFGHQACPQIQPV